MTAKMEQDRDRETEKKIFQHDCMQIYDYMLQMLCRLADSLRLPRKEVISGFIDSADRADKGPYGTDYDDIEYDGLPEILRAEADAIEVTRKLKEYPDEHDD